MGMKVTFCWQLFDKNPHLIWITKALSGLCRGCILGTFSTLKSGMSPIILAVGTHVPTTLRFMNGNITKVTPEKLPMSPYFSMVWVIGPHFSKTLAEHCFIISFSVYVKAYSLSNEQSIVQCTSGKPKAWCQKYQLEFVLQPKQTWPPDCY